MMCVKKPTFLREEKFLTQIVERKQVAIPGLLLTSPFLSYLNVLAEKKNKTEKQNTE
jgi:hypothetical protein